MTLPRLGEAAVADIIERSAVQSGTSFESRPGRRRRRRSGARAGPAVRSICSWSCAPSSTCGSRRCAATAAAAGRRCCRRSGSRTSAGEAGGGLARRALLAASEPGGVSEADLGAPTRRGRNRGAETLAALQSRGLLVAHTRGRKEVFALAHPALRETIEDFAITDRARATNARRALTRRIATGERLRVPELFAVQRHLRGTLTPGRARRSCAAAWAAPRCASAWASRSRCW